MNYTASNTTLKSSYAGTPSLKIKHDFFYTVPKLTGDTVVLGYQNKFVNRLLSISLQYDNVKIYGSDAKPGSGHWVALLTKKANDEKK